MHHNHASLVNYSLFYIFVFQKDLINLEDAENDILLIDDEDLIPYPFLIIHQQFLP